MAKRSSWTVRREISIGTLLQILAILISSLFYVARFEWRVDQLLEENKQMREELLRSSERAERIERYLSSKDPRYWQSQREFSNPQGGFVQ